MLGNEVGGWAVAWIGMGLQRGTTRKDSQQHLSLSSTQANELQTSAAESRSI
jgi:hypothetical protein